MLKLLRPGRDGVGVRLPSGRRLIAIRSASDWYPVDVDCHPDCARIDVLSQYRAQIVASECGSGTRNGTREGRTPYYETMVYIFGKDT